MRAMALVCGLHLMVESILQSSIYTVYNSKFYVSVIVKSNPFHLIQPQRVYYTTVTTVNLILPTVALRIMFFIAFMPTTSWYVVQ